MVLHTCCFPGCRNPAERNVGSCMICGQHLCHDHVRGDSHKCPSYDSDPDAFYSEYRDARRSYLVATLARIQADALTAIASKARNGILCRIPALASDVGQDSRIKIVEQQCGGQNCHLEVVFDDSVVWIARIRLSDPLLPPQPIQDYIFLSEVATLQFLAQTSIPVPAVYHYQLASPKNPVGTSYVLMEKMPGKPLDWGRATTEQRSKVLRQLADIYLEIEKHPLPATGSLIPTKDPGKVGGFAQKPWFTTPEAPSGPFTSLTAAYETIIHQHLQAISNREIASLTIDNYLAFLYCLSVVPDLAASSASREGPFYLKHGEDKGDHILVDDENNITGVIDWEFTSAEPKELAFSSPCIMWPVGDFYDGKNNLAEEEVELACIFESCGRRDLAGCVRDGRRWQRLSFFLGGDTPRDKAEFESLHKGLRSSFANNEDDVSYKEWKQKALDTFARDDRQLKKLLTQET